MPSATERVAARVAELRARRGLTQESLAARAQINRVTLARLERAPHPPNLDTLERIARALGVGLVDLVKQTRSESGQQALALDAREATRGREPVRGARPVP